MVRFINNKKTKTFALVLISCYFPRVCSDNTACHRDHGYKNLSIQTIKYLTWSCSRAGIYQGCLQILSDWPKLG